MPEDISEGIPKRREEGKDLQIDPIVNPVNAYDEYSRDRSQKNLTAVVDYLRPVINYQLANLGAADNPLLRSKARVIAAKAVETYSPDYGAALPTWVSRQLMQLRREKRKSQQVLSVPEKMQMENYQIMHAEAEFTDKHGREPDIIELSDITKLPARRIAKIREHHRATPGETAVQDTADYDVDFSGEVIDYIYRDADYLDRKILEYKTGYGGSKILSPLEIAAKLKISPSQVSRRASRLTLQIEKLNKALEEIS
jgi:DNA-directed RNA polymerase specialized sigma subunit